VALHNVTTAVQAESLPREELGSRLLEVPALQVFAQQIGERIAESMSREPAH
jgi:hypothetical protein